MSTAEDQPQARIMVIDDEPLVGRSLRRSLRGSSVQIVSDGHEAVERLCAGESYDVVFCDLMMPDISGMDVYDQVRKARPDVAERFVFMTGGAFTPRARQFLESVDNPRIEKPFHPETVRELVRQRVGTG